MYGDVITHTTKKYNNRARQETETKKPNPKKDKEVPSHTTKTTVLHFTTIMEDQKH